MKENIENALQRIGKGEINYPQFVSLLGAAGITGYTSDVAHHKIEFRGRNGETHIVQGPAAPGLAKDPGPFDESKVKAAILEAQQRKIDHPAFLKKIYEAGIPFYDVDIPGRKIEYKGLAQSYIEKIPKDVR